MNEKMLLVIAILIFLYGLIAGFVSGKVHTGRFWWNGIWADRKKDPMAFWLAMGVNFFAVILFTYMFIKEIFQK